MKIFRLRKVILSTSALALVMLFGCSSSEEESSDTSSGGGDACKEQCMSLDSHQQDECIVACEL